MIAAACADSRGHSVRHVLLARKGYGCCPAETCRSNKVPQLCHLSAGGSGGGLLKEILASPGRTVSSLPKSWCSPESKLPVRTQLSGIHETTGLVTVWQPCWLLLVIGQQPLSPLVVSWGVVSGKRGNPSLVARHPNMSRNDDTNI